MPAVATLADAEREHILVAFRETGWLVGRRRGGFRRRITKLLTVDAHGETF